jgi:hypothetical protein
LVIERRIVAWQVTQDDRVLSDSSASARTVLDRNFEFRVPLSWILGSPASNNLHRAHRAERPTDRVRLRFSLWQHRLPVDALPTEGWIDLELVPEEDLEAIGG